MALLNPDQRTQVLSQPELHLPSPLGMDGDTARVRGHSDSGQIPYRARPDERELRIFRGVTSKSVLLIEDASSQPLLAFDLES